MKNIFKVCVFLLSVLLIVDCAAMEKKTSDSENNESDSEESVETYKSHYSSDMWKCWRSIEIQMRAFCDYENTTRLTVISEMEKREKMQASLEEIQNLALAMYKNMQKMKKQLDSLESKINNEDNEEKGTSTVPTSPLARTSKKIISFGKKKSPRDRIESPETKIASPRKSKVISPRSHAGEK